MATKPYQSSPVKLTARGYNQYSSRAVHLTKERKLQLRKNMEGYYLGPMDPTQFMTAFMPINSPNFGDSPDGIDLREVYEQPNERSMYEPLLAIATELCTNYVAKFTGDRGDPDESLKPDITLFSKNCSLPEKSDIETSFHHMEMFVELKFSTQSDPFQDLPGGLMKERYTKLGSETRGQGLLYAANQLAYQHRLFALSLVVFGKKARFIRWDREGVVASAVIDYSEHPELVVEFFRRFNQLTDEQRGLDPTATPATPEETEMFDSAAAKIDIKFLKFSVGDQSICPRFKLEVGDPKNPPSYYIVGGALNYDLGVVGRCTRGYLALDLCTKQCVFLKDMWRPDVSGVEPEHVWYEKLIKAQVPHIVKFKHGSDVVPSAPPNHYYGTAAIGSPKTTSLEGAQRGLTHRLAILFSLPNSKSPLQGRVHYRLVQPELCRSLLGFKDSKHLVLIIFHSLEACLSAFEAGLLHRDPSIGNIMIGRDSKGRLNDWDLCRGVDVDESLEGPRTGTWQFMSTKLLANPGAKHTITDDLESHFFVLMWIALHFVQHNRPGEQGINMEGIFDQQSPYVNGTTLGGAGKGQMYGSRKILCNVEFSCKPFNDLFWDLWMFFADYLEARQRADRKGDPEPSVSPQEVIGLFRNALQRPDWIHDKTCDQFPRVRGKNDSELPLPKSDNIDQDRKRRLSNSSQANLEKQPAAKRPRANDDSP